MPNWCYNKLTLKHPDPEFIKKLTEACHEGQLLATICPEPDYKVTPVKKAFPQVSAHFAKTEEEKQQILENKPTIRPDGWWDWRIQNWGTKWDIDRCIPEIIQQGTTMIAEFSTAWSPPAEALLHLAEEHPEVELVLVYYEPGCSFCGYLTVDSDCNDYHTYTLPTTFEEFQQLPQIIVDAFSDDAEADYFYAEEDETSIC